MMPARMLVAISATLAIFTAGCSHRTPTERDLINVDAALPAGLPVQPLEWRVITSSIDSEHHTMATLFGNDAAVTSARVATDSVTYPAGSTLALVTWTQRDDEHWFGGRIPERFGSGCGAPRGDPGGAGFGDAVRRICGASNKLQVLRFAQDDNADLTPRDVAVFRSKA